MAESAAVDGASAPAGVQMAPIESLRPNPDQPRKIFDRDDLEELAASIRDKGVLQPILVRSHPKEGGVWQIIAGERRWRAAQLARLTEAPIIVKEMDDVAVFEVAIIENVQRADLNPLEEADAYRTLMERFGRTQDAVAGVVGMTVAGVLGNAYTTAPSKWPGSQRGRRGVGATVAFACPAVVCRLPGVAAAPGVAVDDAGL